MATLEKIDLDKLNREFEEMSAEDILISANNFFPEGKALSLSMQMDGIVLLDMVSQKNIDCFVYTIDTGRLPHETYQLLEQIRFKYQKDVTVLFPDHNDVEELVSHKGPFSFKESFENRRECCHLRKVKPNQRALKGKQLWITGLRRSQSEDRKHIKIIEYNKELDIYKLMPLANWSWEDIVAYTKERNIPVHRLYAQGYLSIGCAPCNRAVKKGDDPRSGRWWWENGIKECGLHQ